MRAIVVYLFLFVTFQVSNGQVTDAHLQLVNLCDVCTCSEIKDFDGSHLVLNIQCSELDRIDKMDLNKIMWPDNTNELKISAAFEGLALSTLSKLPANLQVETLSFSNNAIKTYWPDPFSDLPNVKKLSLTQNDLSNIDEDLFTNNKHLQDVDISYNKLTDFNPLVFKYLPEVKRLNLQSNRLKRIPLDALWLMTALEDLDLSKNGIYDLLLHKSEDISLKGLKRLNLSGNRIRSVMKDSFPVDNNLELLDLSNNIIEIVEESSFLSCTNLRELNLAQNNITFPFALPPTLQIAILKVNTLYHWPTFPINITYIDLSYNRLSDLYDENEVSFDNLEVLLIAGNQITNVNFQKKLPKLFTLDLSYNSIAAVPKTINSQFLPNLEELRFDGNPMESIYFSNIIAVKSLYMNDMSKLIVVEGKSFSNVVGRTVDETENELSCFSLSLSSCQYLSEIAEGAFDGTCLTMLDISKNNLTRLSKNLVDWSAATDGINMQFNPWECACDLQWVVDDLLPLMYEVNPRLLAELRCGTPRAFEGLRMIHFYNWTDSAMCDDNLMKAGPHGTYLLSPSTSQSSGPKVTSLTLILGAAIIVGLLVSIALIVYLVKSRRRYRVRQAAMKRKRQSATDARNSNGAHKEQFSALNKA